MNKFHKIMYLLDWSFAIVDSVVVGVVWSISKRCTRPRRFSNPCFKFVRNADKDSPFTLVGVGIAVVVAQTNATNNRKVFILIVTKTVKKQPECNFFQTKVTQCSFCRMIRIRLVIIFCTDCTVLAQKFKPISVITTPFSVNAQLHLCSTV